MYHVNIACKCQCWFDAIPDQSLGRIRALAFSSKPRGMGRPEMSGCFQRWHAVITVGAAAELESHGVDWC